MILVQKQFADNNKSKKKKLPESGKVNSQTGNNKYAGKKSKNSKKTLDAAQTPEATTTPATTQKTSGIPIEEKIAEVNKNPAATNSSHMNTGVSESVMSKDAPKSKGKGFFGKLKSSFNKAKESVSNIFRRSKPDAVPVDKASKASGSIMSGLKNKSRASVISTIIDKGAAINPNNNSTKPYTPSAIESTVLGKSSTIDTNGKVPGSTMNFKDAVTKKDIMSSYLPASSAESYQAALGSTGSSSYKLVKPGTGQTSGIRGVGRGRNLNGVTFNPKNMPGYIESSPGVGKTGGIRGVGRNVNMTGATFNPMNIPGYAESTPKTKTSKTGSVMETPKTEIPKTETPKTETLKTETPKTEANASGRNNNSGGSGKGNGTTGTTNTGTTGTGTAAGAGKGAGTGAGAAGKGAAETAAEAAGKGAKPKMGLGKKALIGTAIMGAGILGTSLLSGNKRD